MRKDVRLLLDLAAETGSDLPLSVHVAQIWDTTLTSIPDTADFTHMADYRNKKEAR